MKLRLVLKLSVCVFLILIAMACKKREKPALDCIPQIKILEDENMNGGSFDINPNSEFFTDMVIFYTYKQVTTMYSYSECGVGGVSTLVKMKNMTNKKISFNYQFSANDRANSNLVYWKYSGSATIDPSSTIDLGVVSKHPASLKNHDGGLGCLLENITYH